MVLHFYRSLAESYNSLANADAIRRFKQPSITGLPGSDNQPGKVVQGPATKALSVFSCRYNEGKAVDFRFCSFLDPVCLPPQLLKLCQRSKVIKRLEETFPRSNEEDS